MPQESWKVCGGISWKYIFSVQQWGVISTSLLFAVGCAIFYLLPTKPVNRKFSASDPSLGFPDVEDTIPAAMSVIWPAIMYGLAMLYIEFWAFKEKNGCISNAMAICTHVFLDAAATLLIVVFFTQLANVCVGVLRPDFLARCQNPVCGSDGWCRGCNSDDDHWVQDGRRSFPSGHSSASAAITFHAVTYILYSLYIRDGFGIGGILAGNVLRRKLPNLSKAKMDFFETCQWLYVVLFLLSAWVVSFSRVKDHKHGTADTIGGIVVAYIVAFPLSIRMWLLYYQLVVPKMHVAGKKAGNGSAAVTDTAV